MGKKISHPYYIDGFIYAIHIIAAKSILSHEQYLQLIEPLFLYATGDCPDLPNDVVVCTFLMGALASQDASQRRYMTSCIWGATGGHPVTTPNKAEILQAIREQKFQTIKQLADFFGCSSASIARRVTSKEVRAVYKQEHKKRIIQAVKNNHFQCVDEVANYFHCSGRTIERYVSAKEITRAYLSIPISFEK